MKTDTIHGWFGNLDELDNAQYGTLTHYYDTLVQKATVHFNTIPVKTVSGYWFLDDWIERKATFTR